MTTMTIQSFITTKQKRILHEFLRVHNYRLSTRFKHDFLSRVTGTDLEREIIFKTENPPLVIKLLYDDTKITVQPIITVFKNEVKYKMTVTVTKNKKTYKSKILLIKNLLKE